MRWSRLTLITALLAGLVVMQGIYFAVRPYYLTAGSIDLSHVTLYPAGSEVVDPYGQSLGRVFASNTDPIQLHELPPHFLEALIATEDSRFWSHRGIDGEGMVRAAWQNLKAARFVQGGSTITQQLARQVYRMEERSLGRKLTEAFLALRIEKHYSKDEILEQYVNRIYLGSGCWGVGTAARVYFGKSVSDLSIPEAAMLCGIIKRPSGFSPYQNLQGATDARDRTLQRMADLGFLLPEDCSHFQNQPLAVLNREISTRESGYLISRVEQEAGNILTQSNLPRHGLVIRVSLDPELQNASETALHRVLQSLERDDGYTHAVLADYPANWLPDASSDPPPYLQAAVLVLENHTGRILTYIGGRNHRHSGFDRVSRARRPAGSAFLPLLYARAFDEPAITPRSTLLDVPLDNRTVMIGGVSGVLGEWAGETLNPSFEGEVSAAHALYDAKNSASVRLGYQLGLETFHDFLRQAGISSSARSYPASFLGQTDVSLEELTRAYAVLGNDGQICGSPGLIDYITTKEGRVVYERPEPAQHAILRPESARQITRILQESLRRQPGSAAFDDLGLCSPTLAGKTGTVYGFTDAWFFGYDAHYTCGVWVGFDRPRSLPRQGLAHQIALPLGVAVFNALGSDLPLPPPAESDAQGSLLCGPIAPSSCDCALHRRNHGTLHHPTLTLESTSPPAPSSPFVPARASLIEGPDPYAATAPPLPLQTAQAR